MSNLQSRIILGVIFLALGLVIGMGVAFSTTIDWLTSLGVSSAISLVLGFSVFGFARSSFVSEPTQKQQSAQLIVIFSSFIGLILAVIYKLTTPVATLAMAGLVWVIMRLLVGLSTKRIIDRRHDLKSRPIRQISINNNYMGDALDRHLHMLSDKETRVDYAARPPLIQALILMGIPLELAGVSAWGSTRFAHAAELFHGIVGANFFVRGLAVATLFGLTLLALVSWLEHPAKPLRSLFMLLGLGFGFGIWYAFGSPLGAQLIGFIKADIAHIWQLLLLCFMTWTAARLLTYKDSAYIVTDRTFYKGSDSWLLQTDPVNTMERSKMSNAQIKVGIFRFLLGYQLVKREGLGQEDQKFGRNRVTHGQVLQKVLTN